MFLHGLWRSGSTYVWSRFRALDEACAFYDPLNTELARLSARALARRTSAAAPHLRHPSLDLPYFAEFAPLLKGRGVRGYRRELAFERLLLAPDEPHPTLEAYLGGLIKVARGQDRTPVFGLTGGFGRIGWVAQRLGGRHIHIDRAPEAIWASYVDQMQAGNPWFVARWLEAIDANRRHPMLSPLVDRLPLDGAWLARIVDRKAHYRRAATRMSPLEVYRLTFYVWALAAREALAHCQAIIDIDRLGESRYRAKSTAVLQALTGLAVDFSGGRAPPPLGAHLEEPSRRRIEAEVLKLLPPPWRGAQAEARLPLSALSPRKAERLSALV